MKINKLVSFTLLVFMIFASFHIFTNHERLNSKAMPNSYMKFSTNILLSTNNTVYDQHVEPTLALGNNGIIYVGWKDALTFDGGGYRVSYTYFNGALWQKPVRMPQAFADSRQSDVWMASIGGHLYYAYLEFNNAQTISNVTLADTTDNGLNWNIRTISNAISFADKETMVVRPNGDIFMGYNDIGLGFRLSSSFDGGKTFSDVFAVQDSLDGGTGLYLLLGKNNNLYAFWSNYEHNAPPTSMGDIIFDNSSDSGAHWGYDKALNPNQNGSVFTTNPITGGPMIVSLPTAVYDPVRDRIYVSWSDISADPTNYNFNAYMRYSDDNGLTWSSKYLIADDNGYNQWHPDMALDSSGNVHLVYYDNSTNGYKLEYRAFYPDNNTFSQVQDISSVYTPGHFTRPGEYFGLKIDSNDRIHVAWADGRNGKEDIYYAYMDLRKDTNTAIASSSSTTSSTSISSSTSTSTPVLSSSKTSSTHSKSSRLDISYMFINALIIFVIFNRKRKDYH